MIAPPHFGPPTHPLSLFQIMKTINKIRSKDPDIYNSGKEWFSEGAGESGGSSGK